MDDCENQLNTYFCSTNNTYMPKTSYIFLPLLLFSCFIFGQKKILQTKFITEKISIDAKLDEAAWTNAELANNFIEIFPTNGKPETPDRKSEVRIL